MHPQAAYEELVRRARQQALLASCAEALAWDEETYLPPGGVEHRSNQLAVLASLCHSQAADPRVGELLMIVEESSLVEDPASPVAVNVREWRRRYDREMRRPLSLVEEMARVTTLAQQEWAGARQDSDFERFRPWLEKVLALKRWEGQILNPAGAPYDNLLAEYEPGFTSQELRRLFTTLEGELAALAAAVAERPHREKEALLHRDYPLDRQWAFLRAVAARIGFDFQRGRVDLSTHPFFSSIGPGDCRITARFRSDDFGEGFFSFLHELGHGLYEQGLDPSAYGTPMGEAVSLGVHEAQSRLWENTVGRSQPFWKHFFPLARGIFDQALQDVSQEAFFRAINHVEASPNRVRADEVTYNLHIFVRFELEQALLTGDLQGEDLPAAWNEAYQRHLGISPPNDAEGVLQDSHWASGLIGYFPTYTVGDLFAAQLFRRASEDLANLNQQLAHGKFAELLNWLQDRVFRQGHRHPGPELIKVVTGSPLDPDFLLLSLKQKYGELYGL